MSSTEVEDDAKIQDLFRAPYINNSFFELQYVRAMPGEPTPENAEIRRIPQARSLALIPDPNGLIRDPSGNRFNVMFPDRPGEQKAAIGFEDFVQVLQAVEDVKMWHEQNPRCSLELCWSDKLAELKAKFSSSRYAKLLKFMNDPRIHRELLDGISWRLAPTAFPYSALRMVLGEHTIRLLVLLPAKDKNESIKCKLFQELLGSNPKYEALSYVWGSMEDSEGIEVSDKPFLATKNLAAALRSLRDWHRPRILWVDAICINQQDPLEKETQVNLMSVIYGKASNVLVWLGKATNSTSRAFTFLKLISDKVLRPNISAKMRESWTRNDAFWAGNELICTMMLNICSSKTSEPAIESVLSILSNAYWTRLWVFQEVVLCSTASVICGRTIMDWEDFMMSILATTYFAASVADGRLKTKGITLFLEDSDEREGIYGNVRGALSRLTPLMAIKTFRNQRRANRPITLSSLLFATRLFHTTDPRDKIYALLSIVDQTALEESIVPDYTSSCAKVFTRVAKYLLTSRMNLALFEDLHEPLAHAMMRGKQHDQIPMPSWVPDFRDQDIVCSLDGVNWKMIEDATFYGMLGPRTTDLDMTLQGKLWPRKFNASLEPTSPFPYTFSSNMKVFHISGISVDRVVAVGKLISGGSAIPTKLCLQAWKEVLPSEDANEYPRGGTYQEAYWRTVLCNMWWPHGKWKPPEDIVDRIPGGPHIPPTSPEEEKMLIDTICDLPRLVRQHIDYRKIFLTSSGLLGLGPGSVLPDDEVAILMGGRVPIVLRQSADWFKHDPARNVKYDRVVGESYIHGIMQGEIVKEQRDGKFQMQQFNLV